MYGGLSRKIAGFSNAVQGTQPCEGKVSMAEVKYSGKPGELISTFIWSGLHSGERGEPIRNISGNISLSPGTLVSAAGGYRGKQRLRRL
jgi:hypothetical protein